MPNVLRIIDANANRAREAMRVMEEAVRFILDDAELSAAIKGMRHDFAATMSRLQGLEPNRDTPGDVGTTITTDAEMNRASVAEVVIAAGKRLSEALRAMEEYGKTLGEVSQGFSQAIEALRYRGYEIEKRLNLALASGHAKQWRLCVLISENLCPNGDWFKVAQAVVEAGGDCIQLREKSLDAGDLLVRSKKLVELCKPAGVSVIINDRPDVALAAGADGVHLGQTDLPCVEVRKIVGRQLIIGVSTSKLEEAKQALEDGADYCGVGPMFRTTTKHKEHIVGPDYARQFVVWGNLPHLAIGGIDVSNVEQLTGVGVKGIAVSSAVCNANDPAAVVRELIAKMG